MKTDSGVFRMAVFVCAAAITVLGAAPSILAEPVTLGDASSAAAGAYISGAALSEGEMAALSTGEANAAGLEEIATGSLLSLIGLAVVVYAVLYYLDRN